MTTPFKPIATEFAPRIASLETPENLYWKTFKYPVVIKEFGAVTHINFCPTAPYDFVASTSTRVQVYSTITNKIKRTISRFTSVAYGASYRHDGSLIVAGGEHPEVQIFDANSRLILRTFTGHTRAIRVSKFSNNGTRVFSGSDDKTVRLWDMPTQQQILNLDEHTDYVRAGVTCNSNDSLFLSGGYDHKAKLWDIRGSNSVLTVDHGAPIEAVLMFSTGSAFITAGSNYIRIWDTLTNGKLLAHFSNHQKTITSLAFDEDCERILSGGLDRQVKIYDVRDYSVVHSFKFSSPVLSVALSPNNSHLAVGTTDGNLCLYHRRITATTVSKPEARAQLKNRSSFRSFVRGKDANPGPSSYVVGRHHSSRLKKWDKFLQKFQYARALDSVFQFVNGGKAPLIMSMLHELIQRSALFNALNGRDEISLRPILNFLVKHITDCRYSSLLIDVATVLLDLYAPGMGLSAEIDEVFLTLHKKVQEEIRFHQQLFELLGSLDMLLSCNTTKA